MITTIHGKMTRGAAWMMLFKLAALAVATVGAAAVYVVAVLVAWRLAGRPDGVEKIVLDRIARNLRQA